MTDIAALGGPDDHAVRPPHDREGRRGRRCRAAASIRPRELGRTKVRFMFAKRDETLHEAGERLLRLAAGERRAAAY